MKVCILSNEMYPQHKGGIARMMHNICQHNVAIGRPADLHFLLLDINAADRDALTDFYAGKATLHFCATKTTMPDC